MQPLSILSGKMKTIKDWIFSQLVYKSIGSSRPLPGNDSFFCEEPLDEEFGVRSPSHTESLRTPLPSGDIPTSADGNQQVTHSHNQVIVGNSNQCDYSTESTYRKNLDFLSEIENLEIKFLRLLHRIGHSNENVVAKVLYRLQLATLIRAEESDLKKYNFDVDGARAIAKKQEARGIPGLDFSFRVLVLGKTGVGKSATINSIFDQTKAETDAFQPATSQIREIMGEFHGIKITFIDTPGLLPSSVSNLRKNRKILFSIKRFIRKHPPDVVLYFERLDLINMGYSDFPLLKLITDVFGSSVWFNTILVMTHSSSSIPELPLSEYESYVAQCTDLVQHYIHMVLSDSRLENPVILVENHHQCKKNTSGEKILPNGKVWRSHFLLLCICTKVLSDANTLLKFRNGLELGSLKGTRLPSLPHLLSSHLKHQSFASPSPNEIDGSLSDMEEEDEYDQLPPIRILTKSQFEKLTKSQKREYLDELDYRETLYLKKQMKEETRKEQENNFSNDENVYDNEPVLLPDMALPLSFDSNLPVHRYRCLVSNDQYITRPVLDPQGWDHDVGFDGVNFEATTNLKKDIFASASGQISKDKHDLSIHSEFAAACTSPTGPTFCLGFDVQSAGNKELITTLRSDAKWSMKQSITSCGLCLSSFGRRPYVGAKLEEAISIGKRVKFVMSGGRMGGNGQVAYGGSFEATLRGKGYPVRNDKVNLIMTVLSLDGEMVLGSSFQSDFRLGRKMKMSVNANLNTRKIGQVCIKTSSGEHMEIALLAGFSIIKALLRRKRTDDLNKEQLESG